MTCNRSPRPSGRRRHPDPPRPPRAQAPELQPPVVLSRTARHIRRESTMDFNARIDDLEERVAGVKTSVNAAATETHEQLSKRIDKAHSDADSALNQARQDASAASDKAKDSWAKAHA